MDQEIVLALSFSVSASTCLAEQITHLIMETIQKCYILQDHMNKGLEGREVVRPSDLRPPLDVFRPSHT